MPIPAKTPTQTRVKFGITVRLLRKTKRLSQEDLAELSGLHPNYIGGIERGERNVGIDNVERLALALGVSAAQLFS